MQDTNDQFESFDKKDDEEYQQEIQNYYKLKTIQLDDKVIERTDTYHNKEQFVDPDFHTSHKTESLRVTDSNYNDPTLFKFDSKKREPPKGIKPYVAAKSPKRPENIKRKSYIYDTLLKQQKGQTGAKKQVIKTGIKIKEKPIVIENVETELVNQRNSIYNKSLGDISSQNGSVIYEYEVPKRNGEPVIREQYTYSEQKKVAMQKKMVSMDINTKKREKLFNSEQQTPEESHLTNFNVNGRANFQSTLEMVGDQEKSFEVNPGFKTDRKVNNSTTRLQAQASGMSAKLSNRSIILQDKKGIYRVKYQNKEEEGVVERLQRKHSVFSQSVLDNKSYHSNNTSINHIALRPQENKLNQMTQLDLIIRNGRVSQSGSRLDLFSYQVKQKDAFEKKVNYQNKKSAIDRSNVVQSIKIDLVTAGYKKQFEKKHNYPEHKCLRGIPSPKSPSKGGYRSQRGYTQNLQSSSAIQNHTLNAYVEKQEKPRGMKHVGDNYHRQVFQNRIIKEYKDAAKFEHEQKLRQTNRKKMENKEQKQTQKKQFNPDKVYGDKQTGGSRNVSQTKQAKIDFLKSNIF